MTYDSDKAQIARLRAQMDGATPLRKSELRMRIKTISARLARRDYEAKAAPLRRDIAGAY